MRIPGKIFSLRLGSHYAVEATICKKSTANLTIQGEVFLEKEPLPGYYSKNRVASAQFLTCVTIARPAAAASIFRHSFLTPREKLRLSYSSCCANIVAWLRPRAWLTRPTSSPSASPDMTLDRTQATPSRPATI